MNTSQKEFEVRFLEIDIQAIKKKLFDLGAKDQGEVLLHETIFYDQDLSWVDNHQLLRVREDGKKVLVTYKHQKQGLTMGATEIEFHAGDAAQVIALFTAIGLRPYRHQEKRRHTFTLGEVVLDIDIWPKVPPYIEIEALSEAPIKKVAAQLGLDYALAVLESPRVVLEKKYHIPLSKLRYFTFDRME
jgi:adenylate cyclase class 2